MTLPALGLALAVALLVSAVLTLALVRTARRFERLLDRPNARSLHLSPVPRTGGVAVLAGLLAAAGVALANGVVDGIWGWVGAALLLVALVSFLDDRGEVKPAYRLAAHLAAALILMLGGLRWTIVELPGAAIPLPNVVAVLVLVFYVVWMVNLYNFMDGMDGFAAGMAGFGFAALAALGWRAGDWEFALVNGSIAAAALGFLIGNFPPARIFLGDLGSASLGLLAAACALVGSARGLFPLWIAWLAFSPFIVDATATLLRRLLRGERVWEAHRSHHYQRLVLAGWSHRRTLLWSYLLMGACAATAVAAARMSIGDQWRLLGGWTLIYLLIGYKIRLVERTKEAVSR
ncbi:MAG: glycosyl transferase [Chromatiaceae bacterium]|jgi:UDP-N-acetylmuramyl pentapeptide phosphotransferase/UDP-N-acetylglucosamine-1-phosphate transferase|nr:glycosyl transferase [Chromatiaceae bacterium]